MGLIFENLIRRFNELANETAGDHFTPREVIRLMVSLLFIDDDALLATPGVVRTLLDPACGTGGMLAEAQSWLRDHHREARLYVYGQDYNKRAYATAASDMLMSRWTTTAAATTCASATPHQGPVRGRRLRLLPYQPALRRRLEAPAGRGPARAMSSGASQGRFGAGLPRVNDGSLLFLQHMIAKFEPVRPKEHKHGSRLAIVFSGSPLFTGGAGSGESNIRRWIIENDWLEADRRPARADVLQHRHRHLRLDRHQPQGEAPPGQDPAPRRTRPLDPRRQRGEQAQASATSAGISRPGQIDEIVRLYGRFRDGGRSKIFGNADFGYTRVTVERPLRLRYRMTIDDKARFSTPARFCWTTSRPSTRPSAASRCATGTPYGSASRTCCTNAARSWKKVEQRLFRDVFTHKDPEAEPVTKGGREQGFEPDTGLPRLRERSPHR